MLGGGYVSRGFVVDIPPWVSTPGRCLIWMMALIHRYHFPTLIFLIICSIILSLCLDQNFIFLFLSLIETFYFSLVFHEASHGGYAILMHGKNALKSVSIVPYTIEMWINLDEKIPIEDVCVIAFAGPVFPLLLSGVVSIAIFLLHLPLWFYIYPLIFSLINILSLLPLTECDGGKVYYVIKQKPYLKRVLAWSLPYFFILEFEDIKRRLTG